MGCGASKESSAVSPSLADKKVNLAEKSSAVSSNNTLTKPVIPSIAAQSKKIGQSIAFEIPIDDLFDAKPVVERTSSGRLAQLPALSLSQQDIQAKLSNFEERWKVGAQLDHLLYGDLAAADDDKKHRKKGMKPKLKSRKKQEEDLEALKIRLHERELAAKINREREIIKLQLKLSRQEEHARKVLERKRALGGEDSELRLSYGGEAGKGLAELAGDNESQRDSDGKEGNGNGASRGGSGRSQTTDTTEVEHDIAASNPLRNRKGFSIAGLAPQVSRTIA